MAIRTATLDYPHFGLNSVRKGSQCRSCNKGIRTGEFQPIAFDLSLVRLDGQIR